MNASTRNAKHTARNNKVAAIRYSVNSATSLSIATLPNGNCSVALLVGNRIQNDSVQDFMFKDSDPEAAEFAAVDYAATLVKSVIGEVPLRFFRDNVIS